MNGVRSLTVSTIRPIRDTVSGTGVAAVVTGDHAPWPWNALVCSSVLPSRKLPRNGMSVRSGVIDRQNPTVLEVRTPWNVPGMDEESECVLSSSWRRTPNLPPGSTPRIRLCCSSSQAGSAARKPASMPRPRYSRPRSAA